MIRCSEMRAVIAVAVALWVLTGCSSMKELTSGKRIDYKSTRSTPSLEIPPDLSAPQYDDRYAVASASDLASRDIRAEVRQKTLLPDVSLARLERAGSERWLVVKVPPTDAWETLRKFWIDIGFVLAEEKPMLGIMETDWAENRAEIPQDIVRSTLGKYVDFFYTTYRRDKFRSRIEKGKEPDTVEIYLSHRRMEQVPTTKIEGTSPAAFAWALMPPNPELEAEMLMRIMVRFGATEEQAKTIIAQSADDPQRARLLKEEGGGVKLVLTDDFDRAWRRVGLALDRTGFTVTDRDRAQGVYYVRYADPDLIAKADSGGWLSKLAFWRKDEARSAEQYQVHVAASGEQSVVTILGDAVAVVQSSDAEQILTVLQEQLK
ncbi:MAG: outer membrane protein assembly factor BamC [Burkholderiales bacterium]|jgi:outer membrane protein assembly factor BamC|nr:outer membrane protein assembly factor BamC [Burkholderiales bacterium]